MAFLAVALPWALRYQLTIYWTSQLSPKESPTGTVHLQLDGVATVAKTLGVDAVPAVVGFEFKAGRMRPVHDGVVVPAEAAGLLADAHRAAEASKRDKQAAERARAIWARWRRLIAKAMIRASLQC